MGNYDFVPDPSRLDLAAGWDTFATVCMGAIALFVIVAVLYFLLRGKKAY